VDGTARDGRDSTRHNYCRITHDGPHSQGASGAGRMNERTAGPAGRRTGNLIKCKDTEYRHGPSDEALRPYTS